MPTVRVRYRDGSEDTWEIHPAARTDTLSGRLANALARGSVFGLGVTSDEDSGLNAYGFVVLRLADVIMVEINGLTDVRAEAALFAELDVFGQEPDETPDT
jgi:hypothetical protein